ncbi:MAG: hypothetical protein WCD00_14585, partial [Desulfuromonadaceae bacterium]
MKVAQTKKKQPSKKTKREPEAAVSAKPLKVKKAKISKIADRTEPLTGQAPPVPEFNLHDSQWFLNRELTWLS